MTDSPEKFLNFIKKNSCNMSTCEVSNDPFYHTHALPTIHGKIWDLQEKIHGCGHTRKYIGTIYYNSMHPMLKSECFCCIMISKFVCEKFLEPEYKWEKYGCGFMIPEIRILTPELDEEKEFDNLMKLHPPGKLDIIHYAKRENEN